MIVNLVSAPSEKVMGKEYSYPLSLAYLGRALEDAGHEVEAYDLFKTEYENIDIEELADCDILGLSCLTWNRVATFKIIREAKKINPKLIIIVGGVHPTTLWKQMMEQLPIDFIVLGEGDYTIVELVQAIENKSDVSKIKGIVYRIYDGALVTEPREKIQNLDEIPFPRLDYFLDESTEKMFMITSRGCAFNCAFCSTTKFWGNRWRAQSPKRTVDEIEHWLTEYPNIKHIFFHDDQFCLENKRVIEICKLIIERNLKFSWNCSARVFPISDEMLKWMKDAGCEWITYGVESGSPQQIINMNKKITVEQIKDAFKRTRAAGIRPEGFLFIGIPGENEQTIQETIKLLEEIELYPREVGILEIYPNTDIYRLSVEQGLVNDEHWMTDKPVPLYTHEHSYDELRQMANTVVLHFAKKDKLHFFWFVISHFIKHPIKTFRTAWERQYFKRYLGGH